MTSQTPPSSPPAAEAPAASLADLVVEASPEAVRLSAAAWTKIVVLGALVLAMNSWLLFRWDSGRLVLGNLIHLWRHDPNWTHGFIIPLFSIYLLYSRRHELAAMPRTPCRWGLPLLLLALLAQVFSIFPVQNNWLYEVSMIMTVFALALFVAGTKVIRLTWLPILYLVFAMPIPANLYERVAYPLQELAARASYLSLKLFGVEIQNVASRLEIVSLGGNEYTVTVAEACSGVRSLMAFLALGVAMAYLEDRPIWQRVIFVLSAIPVAIACNVLRVLITCQMYVIDKPDLGKDFMHEFTGMLMLVPALGMLWLIGRLLQALFVEEEDDETSAAEKAAAPGGPSA